MHHGNLRHWYDPRRWLKFRLRTMLLWMALASFALLGKQQWDHYQDLKLAQQWLTQVVDQVHQEENATADRRNQPAWPRLFIHSGTQKPSAVYPTCPGDPPPEEQLRLLMTAAERLADPQLRTAAVKLVYEIHPRHRDDGLLRIAQRSRYADTRVLSLRLLGLQREPVLLPQLQRFLSDRDTSVRIAALEAIGITFDFPLQASALHTATVPPIQIDPQRLRVSQDFYQMTPQSNDDAWRRLEMARALRSNVRERMQRGKTADERHAAARTLLAAPPADYRLRVTACSIWTTHFSGPQLAADISGWVPEHAYQVGACDPEHLATPQLMLVGQTTVQLASNRDLAANVYDAPQLNECWFAYPKPTLVLSQITSSPDAFQAVLARRKILPANDQVRRNAYPWLIASLPYWRTGGRTQTVRTRPRGFLGNVEIAWQNVIVSPRIHAWMQTLPSESGRHVATPRTAAAGCWTTSCGETTQSLFYVSRTLTRSPVAVTLESGTLQVHRRSIWPGYMPGSNSAYDRNPDVPWGLLIVAGAQSCAVRRVQTLAPEHCFAVNRLQACGESEGVALLAATLRELGMSATEADETAQRHRQLLFQRPGRRYVALFGAKVFARFHALQVEPPPTQLIRVGMVVTELPDAG